MIIRPETAADYAAITRMTAAAFADHPYSRNTEQFIITALRAAGALTLSLVAEVEGQVAGHIAFSPVRIAGASDGWHGVGPVSVEPACQRGGIGSALVREGLQQLRGLGSQGCVLAGDPHFYGRFGFRNYPELVYEGIPQEFFLALPFGDGAPVGVVQFHEGFGATE